MDSGTPGRLTVVDSADFAAGHPLSGTQFFVVVFEAPTAVAEPQQALQALLRTPEYKRGFEVGPFPLHSDDLWPGSLQSSDFVEASFPDMVLELAQWLVTGRTNPASDSDVEAGMSALDHAIERFGRPGGCTASAHAMSNPARTAPTTTPSGTSSSTSASGHKAR